MALTGTEIKSVRVGQVSLQDGFVLIRDGEAWLMNCHISPYDKAGRNNPEPRRERKLLLHRNELGRLQGKLAEKGLTLIPLELYFKNGRAKARLGLGRGKRRYDKRQTIRKREEERDMKRVTRGRGRG